MCARKNTMDLEELFYEVIILLLTLLYYSSDKNILGIQRKIFRIRQKIENILMKLPKSKELFCLIAPKALLQTMLELSVEEQKE